MPRTSKKLYLPYKFSIDFEGLINNRGIHKAGLAEICDFRRDLVQTYASRDPKFYDCYKIAILLDALHVIDLPPSMHIDFQTDKTTSDIIKQITPEQSESLMDEIVMAHINGGIAYRTPIKKYVTALGFNHKKVDVEAIYYHLNGMPYRRFSIDWSYLLRKKQLRTGNPNKKTNKQHFAAYMMQKQPNLSYDMLRLYVNQIPGSFSRRVVGTMLHALDAELFPPFSLEAIPEKGE